jgi:hypothetical protein
MKEMPVRKLSRNSKRVAALLLIAVLSLSAASLFVAGAGAKGKNIKLTGLVVGKFKSPEGPNSCSPYPSKVSLLKGNQNVGTFRFGSCDVGTSNTGYSGTATLRVGSLTGKHQLSLVCHAEPPNFTSSKCDEGAVRTGPPKFLEETFRVNASKLPTNHGARFGVVLNTRVHRQP